MMRLSPSASFYYEVPIEKSGGWESPKCLFTLLLRLVWYDLSGGIANDLELSLCGESGWRFTEGKLLSEAKRFAKQTAERSEHTLWFKPQASV
jgi:hypothetical protein